MKHNIALIGFGTVGQGLTEILISKGDRLKDQYGFDYTVVAISDFLKGAVYCPDGLDLKQCLRLANEEKSLEKYRHNSESTHCEFGWDALHTTTETNASIICELTYTDIKTGEPAISHVRSALSAGKHIITSNKGPAALAYKELTELAGTKHVRFMIEGTVMSGTPVLNLAQNTLAGTNISSIQGILNGTTNFILSQMEEGQTYADALTTAQKLGYAEADPTADVEGFDAQAKVTILANVLMDANLTPSDVPCTGITRISQDDIQQALNENNRWKLIGTVKKDGDKVTASVESRIIPLSHPLATVSGATNAITFTTDLLGDVTIKGPGAGRKETGYSILTDILEIHRSSGLQ